MSNPIRLAVIGAGSATFSLGLVKDICLTQNLAGSQISFMDIDTERLEMIRKLAVRYAKELGSDLRFESTTDRRASLKDANFVINTASTVPYEVGLRSAELAERHGYYFGMVPNAGYGYYNISFMMDVAHDIEQVCPDAWLIQSGNPVYEGCTLMTRETGVKVCGLCHGHYGYEKVARMIGLDPHKVTWQAPGLNHNIWLTHFGFEGQDAYPLLDAWIASKGEAYWNSKDATKPVPPGSRNTPELVRAWDIDLSRAAVNMYKMFGLMPIGDTPWNRQVAGWWFNNSLESKKHWYGEPWGGQYTKESWTMYVRNLERHVAQIASLAQDPKASIIGMLGSTKTHEQQVPIIDGLVNNVEGQFQVNVPNRGALEGVADDVVVEVPAIVNQKGIQPIHVGKLPPKIMLMQILPNVLRMERELLALKTGDRSLLLWNVLDNHQTSSYDQALAVLEELLGQEFNGKMNAYYQWPRNW
jgi:alpha-galactosidase